jgi:Raf kinase inhibitor-like YbhB/YbcL family protein
MTLKLTSPSFQNNDDIPVKFTCQGDDVNPELQIQGVPELTESLLLLVTDPDAPSKTWLHWCMYDIHPDTNHIPENCPENYAQQTKNDFDNPGYGGPCPPKHRHQYVFRLYALKSKIGLPQDAKLADILIAIEDEIIESAELVGYFQKS